MKIEIDSKRNNPLLNRTEIYFTINHEGEGTPNREIIRNELAEKLNVNKENVIVNTVQSSFGTQEITGYAKVYSSLAKSKNIERNYILVRNKLIESEKKEKKAEVGPAPPPKVEGEEKKQVEVKPAEGEKPGEEPPREEKPPGEPLKEETPQPELQKEEPKEKIPESEPAPEAPLDEPQKEEEKPAEPTEQTTPEPKIPEGEPGGSSKEKKEEKPEESTLEEKEKKTSEKPSKEESNEKSEQQPEEKKE